MRKIIYSTDNRIGKPVSWGHYPIIFEKYEPKVNYNTSKVTLSPKSKLPNTITPDCKPNK